MKKRQKSAFGEFLVVQIKNADLSQEEFYNSVGIKKPYFYDLLTATPPPIDLQNRMLAVLDGKSGKNEERTRRFYDLAAKGRNEIPGDIVKMITDNPQKIGEIRTELISLLSTK